MPALPGTTRIERITPQWLALAERRLDHFTELYRSGRWRRYYTEERFTALMADVAKTVKFWRDLASRQTPDKDDRRPAA